MTINDKNILDYLIMTISFYKFVITLENIKLFVKDRRANSEFKISCATPTPPMISKTH